MRAIDADRLLTNRMKSKYYHLPNGDIAIPIIDIEHAPTVQPQRTGRWIPQKGGGLCCSECGGYALDEPDGNFVHVAVPSKFCPHCRARMEGE